MKADFLRLILGAGIDPARESLLVDLVDTYMPLQPREEAELQQTIASGEQFREVRKMMTFGERREKTGMEKGQQKLLILQLEKKFGKIPPGALRKIQAIKSERKLESVALTIMEARSLEELNI